VVALSRFGAFGNLAVSHSASDDVFANTPTLTFHGVSYTSQYVSFQGVETATNTKGKDGRYGQLDTLTAEQQKILDTVGKPPYVPANEVGSIPLLDIGNRYLITGASYDPGVLAGKRFQQIADALKNPNDPIAQSVGGTANALTAAICKLTNGQPGDVCTSAAGTAYSCKV
jgi:hypothetical protein